MARSFTELCKPPHHDKAVIHEGDVVCILSEMFVSEKKKDTAKQDEGPRAAPPMEMTTPQCRVQPKELHSQDPRSLPDGGLPLGCDGFLGPGAGDMCAQREHVHFGPVSSSGCDQTPTLRR